MILGVIDRVPQAGTSRRALLRSALAAGLAAGTAGLPVSSAPRFPAADGRLIRPRVARLGDSITQFAEVARNEVTAKLSRRARGAMTWVKTLFPAFNDDTWHDVRDMRHRRFMRGSNNGVAGDHLGYLSPENPGTLHRWAREVAPMRPDVVLLSVGTNDLNSFSPAAVVRRNLRRQIAEITATGAIVIVTTIRPRGALGRGAWAMPDQARDTRYAARREVNDWLLAQHGGRVLVADVNTYLEDPSSRGGGGGDWLPELTPMDGVHPDALAAWAEARALLPILRTLVAPGNVYGTDPLAPGNLLPNGGFTGTTGLVGWGADGHCASGWAIARRSGDARVHAYTTVEDGIGKQVLEFTPGYHDSTFVLRTDPLLVPLTGLPPGSWLRFHLAQEVSAHPGWLAYNPRLLIARRDRTWSTVAGALETVAGERLPDAGWSGWPATHPVRLSPDDVAAACSILITVAGGVPGTPVLRFSRAQLRRVPDPRPAWHAATDPRAEPVRPIPPTSDPLTDAQVDPTPYGPPRA
jgi:Lysophospholipase L1 and related esterases